MAQVEIQHLDVAERTARGEEARRRTPPSDHAGWHAAPGRPDPVALLEEQDGPGNRTWSRSGTAG